MNKIDRDAGVALLLICATVAALFGLIWMLRWLTA